MDVIINETNYQVYVNTSGEDNVNLTIREPLADQVAALENQTGNYYTKDNPSHYSTSGDLNLISGNLQNDINNRLLISQTGQFYPAYNPNNYSSSGDLNSTSGYLQSEINLINSGGLISTGNADLRYYPKSSNPSGYIPLTSGNNLYYGGNNPSGYTTSAAVTGYVTGLSGQFYPRSGNPSGFLTVSTLPAASTSASGVVQLGTLAEARDSTSTTKTPSLQILRSMLLSDLRILDLFNTSSAVTGTAAVTVTSTTQVIDANTGATAGSTWARVGMATYFSVGAFGAISQAAGKPFSYAVTLTPVAVSANGIFRFLIGNNGGAAAPTSHAVGFEVRNLRLWTIAHNGTTLRNTDTGYDLTTSNQTPFRIIVSADGAGNMSLYVVNNSTTYSDTGAPTGAFTAVVLCGGTNGADASSNRWTINRQVIAFGQ